MERNWRESARLGACWGAVIWGAYAVTESAFFTLRPLLQHYADYVSAAHVRWSLLFWLIYLGIGSIAGALGGMFVARLRSAATSSSWKGYQAAAAASLALAFVANQFWAASIDPASRAPASLAAGSGLLAAAVAALVWPRAARWLAPVFGPWTLSMLLLGAGFAATGSYKRRGALLAAVAIAALLSRRWLDPEPGAAVPPRRHVWALAAAVLLLAGGVALSSRGLPALPEASTPPGNGRPNIVLVVLDTVRADHLSLYGYSRPTTPFLESLSRQATVYVKAVATSNFTLPSHASIFTGLYPRSHGAIIFPPGTPNFHPLERKFETLAEILRSQGYRTVAVSANSVFVNPDYGLAQGFELFSNLRPVRFLSVWRRDALRFLLRRLLNIFISTQRIDEAYRDGASITNDALALFARAAASGRPVFLFLNYMDAHEPYVVPPPYDTAFAGRNPRLNYDDYGRMVREVVGRRREVTENERNHFVSQYDGAIAFLDRQLERLVDGLRSAGLWDNTMFIVTSDHGEAFGEHQFVGHSVSLYQDHLSIPLLIRYPGLQSSQTVRSPVSLVDLMPTILDVAGIPAPQPLQGRSLLRAEELDGSLAFAESNADPEVVRLRPRCPPTQTAVISGDKKLIVSAGLGEELYDLSRDPGETANLVSVEPEAAEALRRSLNAWVEKTPLRVDHLKRTDPKALERLRQFGYIH
jgi:arylsulfatase A-like enzyme